MADDASAIAQDARAKAYATPLEDFDVSNVELFTSDTLWPWFESTATMSSKRVTDQ